MARNNQATPDDLKLHHLFLNIGHLIDHLCMLIFATVAALILNREWGLSYAELIPYATPGFIAFGAFAIPAGWLADRWSREGMMVIFFSGIGLASIFCATASSPLHLGLGLSLIGVFAAIYHPVGIGLLLDAPGSRGMRVAINGVWGNMGVGVAALLTGFLIDVGGWRSAFWLPGAFSLLLGVAYYLMVFRKQSQNLHSDKPVSTTTEAFDPAIFKRVLLVVLLTTALGGLVFQSTTFSLPKVLAERTMDLSTSATIVGWLAFFIFAIGSAGQLIVGYSLDRRSPRTIFLIVATMQAVFFAAMIGANGWVAILMATGFMLAAFGQIPINDVLVGRVAKSEWRSRILAVRYTVTIGVMASSIPLIAWIHANWGFDRLFIVLAVAAVLILLCVWCLPGRQLNPVES